MAISTHTTVARLVTQRPTLARIFDRLGVDYSCNEDRSLAKACQENGLDPTTVVEMIDASLDVRPPSNPTDWTRAPLGDLIDHIVDTHHAYLRRELPRLETLLMQVTEAHSPDVPWLDPVLEVFQTLKLDVQTHIMTEEERVFPSIRALSNDEAVSETRLDRDGIEAMIKEHDDSDAALERLRNLTNGYTPPEDACPKFRAALDGLHKLEMDMDQHVHKENNILFPRARSLA